MTLVYKMKIINKIDIIATLVQDYRRIDTVLMSYIGENEKSLNKAREVLYNTIESLLNEMKLFNRSKRKVKDINSDYENAPNTLFIRDDKGIYRTYTKINYFIRNIIYASYGYGIDLKNFTYGELQHAINNKEIFVK